MKDKENDKNLNKKDNITNYNLVEKTDCCDMDMNHGDKHDMKHMDHCDMDMSHGDKHDMKHMDHCDMDMSHGDKHDMKHMDHCDMHNMGHDHGSMHHMGNLKQKFWISMCLAVPIILLSPMMGMNWALQIKFPGSDFIVLILGTILFVYGGYPFFTSSVSEVKSKSPGMMSLITLGISVAYIYSVYAIIANDILRTSTKVSDFFWELSTLIVIMLLGHWIEMNSVMSAGSAVDKLAQLLPDKATLVLPDGSLQNVKVSDLTNGQTVVIKSGEKIPADGDVIDGNSKVNESLITGESVDVNKQIGDKVIGGSINQNGVIKVKITGTGDTGYLSKVMTMVSEAQNSKSKTENLANKVAGYLFYAAILIASVSFVSWSIIVSPVYAIPITVSVLIIACPHALGLAIPLIVSRMTALSATHGLLIRNKNSLENINKIRYALMDKTGTLTEGEFKVNGYDSLINEYSSNDIIQIAASLEQTSSHPLASGILEKLNELKMDVLDVKNITNIPGYGVSAEINLDKMMLVSSVYLDIHDIKYDVHQTDNYLSKGNSLSYVVKNDTVIGYIAEGDSIKDNAKEMVSYLQQQHITPVMLTGDNPQSANKVAKLLGIKEIHSQLLPEDKQAYVSKYQDIGEVMFVGDGINDAPSLTKSNLGIAIGSGTDVAIDSADVVLVNSSTKSIIDLIKLAKQSHLKMVENLWWGAGYNIVALPLSAGLLSGLGIIIGPMFGAVIMSLSTVIVAINAMTLKIK
jgi:P-type Cu2+ transporter